MYIMEAMRSYVNILMERSTSQPAGSTDYRHPVHPGHGVTGSRAAVFPAGSAIVDRLHPRIATLKRWDAWLAYWISRTKSKASSFSSLKLIRVWPF
jgi:hypothetical protein